MAFIFEPKSAFLTRIADIFHVRSELPTNSIPATDEDEVKERLGLFNPPGTALVQQLGINASNDIIQGLLL